MDTKLHDISLYLIGLLIAVSLLTGCSGIKPYPNTLTKNLRIRTETESGSIFSKVRADVEIYRVDESCQIKYEGNVSLNKSLVEVGIPSDRLSYLVFSFSSSSYRLNSEAGSAVDEATRIRIIRIFFIVIFIYLSVAAASRPNRISAFLPKAIERKRVDNVGGFEPATVS